MSLHRDLLRAPLRWATPLAALAILAGAAPAPALPTGVIYGFDMDQISTPRFTEPGLVSVTILTPPDEAPFDSPTAGYPTGERPFTDFRILPISDPSASTDLWADAHYVTNPLEATLRITGIAPGTYTLLLLSYEPGLGVPQETAFWLNGATDSAGSVVNDPSSTDLFADQSLSVTVEVDASQSIEIRFAPVGTSLRGVLNGVLLVPAPGAAPALLLGLGLAFRGGHPQGRTR